MRSDNLIAGVGCVSRRQPEVHRQLVVLNPTNLLYCEMKRWNFNVSGGRHDHDRCGPLDYRRSVNRTRADRLRAYAINDTQRSARDGPVRA